MISLITLGFLACMFNQTIADKIFILHKQTRKFKDVLK